MGNYADFETDFVERTIALIEQYTGTVEERPFPEQFNYTLILNCLLGLIVMPKERVISRLPADRLTSELKAQMGLRHSSLPGPEMTLKNLIIKMRHSVAHFSIETRALSPENLMDEIVFIDTEQGSEREVYAIFKTSELFSFLKYYADSLVTNLHRRSTQRLNLQEVQ
ncbi:MULTISPECIES: HEPN family nuclease [Klebsiella]|uniref:pEK499-p136 HEPN domain-containing protein n=1 Tax=Salmonella enterica subsp. enterica serovar Sanjuan TaxID=1160765 RepID=A0A3S4G2A4_SALET|nr:HEPN family nuclease [Klebsiella michiganensis]EFU2869691.1 hypothetical protein [Salmonella enterica]NKD26501.1 hypothetical protein [Citrobacter freundii]VEA04323.1 Uncharacterised protein [Salmonella enterica subsp. enterica serovar Sanjuan]HBS6039706.1 hypothetical protein [Klebsiella aerogenes]HEM6802503.1 hypothetical protein [Citrobacter koseri]